MAGGGKEWFWMARGLILRQLRAQQQRADARDARADAREIRLVAREARLDAWEKELKAMQEQKTSPWGLLKKGDEVFAWAEKILGSPERLQKFIESSMKAWAFLSCAIVASVQYVPFPKDNPAAPSAPSPEDNPGPGSQYLDEILNPFM